VTDERRGIPREQRSSGGPISAGKKTFILTVEPPGKKRGHGAKNDDQPRTNIVTNTNGRA